MGICEAALQLGQGLVSLIFATLGYSMGGDICVNRLTTAMPDRIDEGVVHKCTQMAKTIETPPNLPTPVQLLPRELSLESPHAPV